MTDEDKQTLKDLFRVMNDMRAHLQSIDGRLERIEADRLDHRQRMQAVEQHAAAFVEQGANINRRLDDVAERLDRLERQPAR